MGVRGGGHGHGVMRRRFLVKDTRVPIRTKAMEIHLRLALLEPR